MYSGHNFYFKPYIASLALLPVTDRKSLEALRFQIKGVMVKPLTRKEKEKR